MKYERGGRRGDQTGPSRINYLSTPPALLGYHVQADWRIFWFEFFKQYQLKQEVLKFVGSKDECLGPCQTSLMEHVCKNYLQFLAIS